MAFPKKKPSIDVGILFGSPKKGADGGPTGDDSDGEFKDLAHTALDDNAQRGARVSALIELIRSVCEEQYRKEEDEEGDGDEEKPEEGTSSGGF